MEIIRNAADIRKGIKAVGAAREKLVDKVQVLALSVIAHAHMHGDVTLANELCVVVGKGMKHEALRLYMSDFGPMAPNADAATKNTAPMKYSKAKLIGDADALAAHMERAALVKWYDYKTEKAAEAWSFAADLHKLLGKLDKAIEQGVELSDAEREVATMLRNAAASVPKPTKAKAQPTVEA